MKICEREITLPFLLDTGLRETNVGYEIEYDVRSAKEFFYDITQISKDYLRAGFSFKVDRLKRLYLENFQSLLNEFDAEAIAKHRFYENLLMDFGVSIETLKLGNFNKHDYEDENTESENSYSKGDDGHASQTTNLQSRDVQNQEVYGGIDGQSGYVDSRCETDGLADVAIVSEADHHFHLWEECVIDNIEYIITGLSRDYIRCEYAEKELSKRMKYVEVQEDKEFAEMSLEDLEKEIEENKELPFYTNDFKADFIKWLVYTLENIEDKLYREFDLYSIPFARENQAYNIFLNKKEYMEYLEYEMRIGKNDDDTDKFVKVTVFFSYRSDGYRDISIENRIEDIFIEDTKSNEVIRVDKLEYDCFYNAVCEIYA